MHVHEKIHAREMHVHEKISHEKIHAGEAHVHEKIGLTKKSGYADLLYFSRVFHHEHGCSPHAWCHRR
jgi:AraC-like DNA-binding protein